MNDMTLNLADEATVQRLADALALQRKAYLAHPVPTLAERQADLRTLQRFVRENKEALAPTTATARATRRCWPKSCRSSTASDTRSNT
ncbi:MAG: hypothetical protein MUF08_19290 [Burkholderiaceae bacterium]|nr:hypothetical protein [Burkholderiaceae bacterium]